LTLGTERSFLDNRTETCGCEVYFCENASNLARAASTNLCGYRDAIALFRNPDSMFPVPSKVGGFRTYADR